MERDAILRLREEIKQTKPFQDRSHAAGLALLRTADESRRFMEILLAPLGISAEQYNVLRILRGAGEKGLPTLEIAARLLERNPGITRLVDKLETKNLVCRSRCTTDRRQVFCTITAAGVDLLNNMDEPARFQAQYFFRGLSAAQLDTLIDLLDLVRYPEQIDRKERQK
jgi:DNA-binding MarR family transcriptional regulator